jgi:site-specific DNA-methyltransferase (adenine-specific)
MDLRNGDCLEILKDIPSKSIDLVFADLPYGQVACKWDCKIDLELLWKELLRVAKSDNTPFFFTCTTKFGYELISSNKKMFKYDLVWAKSTKCGFLQAKKQPMRKHEMVYVFYKKQPAYDISSHKYNCKKEENTEVIKEDKIIYDVEYEKDLYGVKRDDRKNKKEYDPPLPASVIKEDNWIVPEYSTYGSKGFSIPKAPEHRKQIYEPALPVSVIKEDDYEPSLPDSLLEINSIRLRQHSTAKPPDLMKWILKYYTKEGDMVLDPTMGSNPMGLACKEMNRNYIGIEKDPDIYKFACSRVE